MEFFNELYFSHLSIILPPVTLSQKVVSLIYFGSRGIGDFHRCDPPKHLRFVIWWTGYATTWERRWQSESGRSRRRGEGVDEKSHGEPCSVESIVPMTLAMCHIAEMWNWSVVQKIYSDRARVRGYATKNGRWVVYIDYTDTTARRLQAVLRADI